VEGSLLAVTNSDWTTANLRRDWLVARSMRRGFVAIQGTIRPGSTFVLIRAL
jgi:hypothetical protein